MNQPFDKLSEVAKKLQAPLQEMTELNVKTLQSFTYLKPDELTKLKKPEDLLNLAVENGHKTLDYMQESFKIFEKAMLSFVQDIKTKH